MDCLECNSLEEALEVRLSKYNEARSAAYYQVSTELAAKKNVDMERARNDLEEHRLICVPAGRAETVWTKGHSSGFRSRSHKRSVNWRWAARAAREPRFRNSDLVR